MFCPKCGGELRKKKGKVKTAEHVKHCIRCGSGWFIICTSRGRESVDGEFGMGLDYLSGACLYDPNRHFSV